MHAVSACKIGSDKKIKWSKIKIIIIIMLLCSFLAMCSREKFRKVRRVCKSLCVWRCRMKLFLHVLFDLCFLLITSMMNQWWSSHLMQGTCWWLIVWSVAFLHLFHIAVHCNIIMRPELIQIFFACVCMTWVLDPKIFQHSSPILLVSVSGHWHPFFQKQIQVQLL